MGHLSTSACFWPVSIGLVHVLVKLTFPFFARSIESNHALGNFLNQNSVLWGLMKSAAFLDIDSVDRNRSRININ